MKHPALRLFWKIVSISLGSLLILLGIVAGFVPILQGWLLILAGLALLSPHSRWAHAIMTWLKAKLHRRRGPDAKETAGPAEDVRRDRRAGM